MNILLLEALIPEAREWLEARHNVALQPGLTDDPSALRKAIYNTDAVLVSPRVVVNREFLDFAPRLSAVARMNDATDNIDLELCRERRIRVIQPTTANVRANAEYLLAGLLLLCRRGLGAPLLGGKRGEMRMGRELHGSVVGLLGLAPAAHALGMMLAPMGVKLIGYDPAVHHSSPIWSRLNIKPVSMFELMENADLMSVQVMYASRYRGFVNDKLLAHCKRGQGWVSVGRTSLFDTTALAAALQDGRIEAAVIDTSDPAFAGEGSPLKGLETLMLTQRLASFTRESRLRSHWYVADRMHETIAAPQGSSIEVAQSAPMDLEQPFKEPTVWGAGQATAT